MSQVAVLILNWRQYARTRLCLEGLHALETPPEPRLYLIDNASDAAALRELIERFPAVTPIPLADNRGFAGGMNAGIRQALADGADYVVLLNNDALITPPTLRQLLAMFENHHLKAGIVGPSLRTLPPDERVQAVGLDVNRWSGRVVMRHAGVSPELLYPYPHQVDAVTGACMMVSREVLEAVGPLDEDYFFYFEDVDLCLRARDAGYQVFMVPGAVVYHEGGATIGDSPDGVYYGVRNQLKVIRERGLPVSLPVRVGRSAFIVGLHLAQIVKERRMDLSAGVRAVARGLTHHRQQRYGPASP